MYRNRSIKKQKENKPDRNFHQVCAVMAEAGMNPQPARKQRLRLRSDLPAGRAEHDLEEPSLATGF